MSGKKWQRRRRALKKENQRKLKRAMALLTIKYPNWHNTGRHEGLYTPVHSVCLCKVCVQARALSELGIRI